MSKHRYDIGEEEEKAIRKSLQNGSTVFDESIKYNCSQGLIRSIRDKTRTPSLKKTSISDDELCTACGLYKKTGRFLCDACYRKG